MLGDGRVGTAWRLGPIGICVDDIKYTSPSCPSSSPSPRIKSLTVLGNVRCCIASKSLRDFAVNDRPRIKPIPGIFDDQPTASDAQRIANGFSRTCACNALI